MNARLNVVALDKRSLHQLLSTWRATVAGTSHPQPPPYTGPDVALTGFTEKTSEVEPGMAFVARVRTGSDGHPYIGQALARGASLILAQRPAEEVGVVAPPGVVYLTVADTAETLAWLAAAWEGFPSQSLVVIGITGTDGKTSTANILFSILRAAGLRAGLLSTIRAVIGDEEEPLALHVTTPEAPVVQRYLRRMVEAGLTHAIVEATSHALAQSRVAAVTFDMAVVTNITHEHLDYHGSADAYFAAKRRLFESLLAEPLRLPAPNPLKSATRRTAVLNRDDSSFAPLAAFLAGQPVDVRAYGLTPGNAPGDQLLDAWAGDIVYGPGETRLGLHLAGHAPLPVASTLVGEFNVANMLAASATAAALGIAPHAIGRGLEAVRGLSGRMERIDRGQPFLVVVDFAHTPNALARAIAAARAMIEQEAKRDTEHHGGGKEEHGGRVESSSSALLLSSLSGTPRPSSTPRTITVFGSAGKRDVEKRRLMAEISARAADLTVLTAEDPRTESLDAILSMMAEAATAAGGIEGETFWRVPDRGRAIYFALTLARPGDVVLLCGKGHEQSMAFGATEYPWDDRRAAAVALEAFMEGGPMPDLGLPTFVDDVLGDHALQ